MLKYTHKHTIAHTIKRKAVQTPKWESLKHISNACIFENVKVKFKHVFSRFICKQINMPYSFRVWFFILSNTLGSVGLYVSVNLIS